jgi:hypothetical protein
MPAALPGIVYGATFCEVPILYYNSAGVASDEGVHQQLLAALQKVEQQLRAKYALLPPRNRPATFKEYAGVKTITCKKPHVASNGRNHINGVACDINYAGQPHIAVRTGATYGGENGDQVSAATTAVRKAAVEVYDRAVAFVETNPYAEMKADVSAKEEAKALSYARFKRVSDALKGYLGLVFNTNLIYINRKPPTNLKTITDTALEALIPAIGPLAERKTKAAALLAIQAYMKVPDWIHNHDPYNLTAEQLYYQILRDYEKVRIPMLVGSQTTAPAKTRNPARGFLDMPEHLVVALGNIKGMRWGATNFGPSFSGDMMHFDLGYHFKPVPAPYADSNTI